jgi:hypothetical protein
MGAGPYNQLTYCALTHQSATMRATHTKDPGLTWQATSPVLT